MAADRPVIIFLHNYGGDSFSTRRQQEMVANMDFEFVSLTLSQPKNWVREFTSGVEKITGPKIFFSLSFPSFLVAQYLAERKPKDIISWVCDGGPFGHLWPCLLNYFTYAQPTPNSFSRLLHAGFGYWYLGGFGYASRSAKWVSEISSKLPILSIRAGSDLLVPAEAIDSFFAGGEHLDIRRLVIPGVHHLEGLKRNPELYKQEVGRFLKQFLGDGHSFNSRN